MRYPAWRWDDGLLPSADVRSLRTTSFDGTETPGVSYPSMPVRRFRLRPIFCPCMLLGPSPTHVDTAAATPGARIGADGSHAGRRFNVRGQLRAACLGRSTDAGTEVADAARPGRGVASPVTASSQHCYWQARATSEPLMASPAHVRLWVGAIARSDALAARDLGRGMARRSSRLDYEPLLV